MATPQKPVFFDGRQLRRASSTYPIDTDVLETDVVVTDGSRGFTGPVTGVAPVSDAGLTPRLYVNHMIADGFWAYPVESIRSVPPVGPLNEQRWIVGASPTGVWAGNANSIATYRNGAWVFIPAVIGVCVFNKATTTYVHYKGSSWSTIAGLGTVTSVGLVLPSSEFNITLSPVTGFGNLTAEWKTQAPGTVFAGPLGATPGVPGFRALGRTDIPSLDWSHITTGLPTTLAGYGITDGALKGDIKASGLIMATSRLLGRVAAAGGAVEEIAVGAGLALAGGLLICTVTGSSLNATQVGYGSSLNGLTGSENLVYDDDIGTGGLFIKNTTATTDAFTGALLVAGGVSLGADLRVEGALILSAKAANLVFASPNGSAGIPGFRGLVVADVSGAAVDASVVHLAGPETITGIKTFTAALTSVGDPIQDGIRIQGRAGGDQGYMATLTPGVLTGSHTYTLPDKDGTLAMTSDIVVPGLPATQVGFGGSDNLLTGSTRLTYLSEASTGGLRISNTTTSTSTTTGALVVSGGVGIQGDIYGRSIYTTGGYLGTVVFPSAGNYSVGLTNVTNSTSGNPKFAVFVYTESQAGNTQVGADYAFARVTGGAPASQIAVIGKTGIDAGVTAASIGVYGGGNGTNDSLINYTALSTKSTIGVMGVRRDNYTGNGFVTNIGVYGEASGATDNYAGMFLGDVLVTGTLTARVAATQDSLQMQGRAGGTDSYIGTLIPTVLSAHRTYTLPDKDGTIAMTSDILAPSLPETQVGFGDSSNLLTGSANFTYVSNLSTGGLTIANTIDATSTTTGALKVAGGIGVVKSVYVGSDVSVGGTLIIKNVNEAVNAIGNTGAGTVTVNCLTANRVTLTVTGISTLAFSNVPAAGTAKTMVLHITNGGAFTLSFPAGTRWAGGIAPALMASGLDIIGLTTIDGGTTWDGVPMSLNSKVP